MIPTPQSRRWIARRLDYERARRARDARAVQAVLAAMRRGAVLGCTYRPVRTIWSLSTGTWVTEGAARLAIADPHVVARDRDLLGAPARPPSTIFVLRLVALPGVDAIRALRWALKGLLRRCGMRCVGAEILETTTNEGENNVGRNEQAKAGNSRTA
jgi:hypothetical protein